MFKNIKNAIKRFFLIPIKQDPNPEPESPTVIPQKTFSNNLYIQYIDPRAHPYSKLCSAPWTEETDFPWAEFEDWWFNKPDSPSFKMNLKTGYTIFVRAHIFQIKNRIEEI